MMRSVDNRDLSTMEVMYLARIEALQSTVEAQADLIMDLRDELEAVKQTYTRLRSLRYGRSA